MYKAIFALGYYGLFRIGELTSGSHPIKANDVHIGSNKNKMLFILRTSKTHGRESRPQKVKITGYEIGKNKQFFCPFELARDYVAERGNYQLDSDPFFVFRDNSPVEPQHARHVLRNTLTAINLNPELYTFHSLRSGRCTDLANFNVPILHLKLAGRWRSNVVYKYIKRLQLIILISKEKFISRLHAWL